MTETDDLLSKADALLAKWRVGRVTSNPQSDYPLLTDVVDARQAGDAAPVPEIPAEPEIPAIDSAATAAEAAVPVLDFSDVPELDAPPTSPSVNPELTALNPEDDLPHVPAIHPRSAPASAEVRSMEERIRSRVLEAVEPRIQAYLDNPLRHRLEDVIRETAARVATETREDILALIRDAVRAAVAQEFTSQQDTRLDGH